MADEQNISTGNLMSFTVSDLNDASITYLMSLNINKLL